MGWKVHRPGGLTGHLKDICLNVLTQVPFSLKEGASAGPCRNAVGTSSVQGLADGGRKRKKTENRRNDCCVLDCYLYL